VVQGPRREHTEHRQRLRTEYTLARQGGSTIVTWAMYGPQPYMAKVMSVFMSMDRMVGKDFEQGLANMKAIAEKP
jgi:hypothetical protein